MRNDELLERPPLKRKRGRPRRGDLRLEVVLAELIYNRLVARAKELGTAPNRLAADILFKMLLG